MGSADSRLDVLRHIAGNSHGGSRAVIADHHLVSGYLRIVDGHRVNVAQREDLTHNGQRRTVGIGHVACLSGRKLIRNIAHFYVQCLAHGCYRQHKGHQECIYLLHLAMIL